MSYGVAESKNDNNYTPNHRNIISNIPSVVPNLRNTNVQSKNLKDAEESGWINKDDLSLHFNDIDVLTSDKVSNYFISLSSKKSFDIFESDALEGKLIDFLKYLNISTNELKHQLKVDPDRHQIYIYNNSDSPIKITSQNIYKEINKLSISVINKKILSILITQTLGNALLNSFLTKINLDKIGGNGILKDGLLIMQPIYNKVKYEIVIRENEIFFNCSILCPIKNLKTNNDDGEYLVTFEMNFNNNQALDDINFTLRLDPRFFPIPVNTPISSLPTAADAAEEDLPRDYTNVGSHRNLRAYLLTGALITLNPGGVVVAGTIVSFITTLIALALLSLLVPGIITYIIYQVSRRTQSSDETVSSGTLSDFNNSGKVPTEWTTNVVGSAGAASFPPYVVRNMHVADPFNNSKIKMNVIKQSTSTKSNNIENNTDYYIGGGNIGFHLGKEVVKVLENIGIKGETLTIAKTLFSNLKTKQDILNSINIIKEEVIKKGKSEGKLTDDQIKLSETQGKKQAQIYLLRVKTYFKSVSKYATGYKSPLSSSSSTNIPTKNNIKYYSHNNVKSINTKKNTKNTKNSLLNRFTRKIGKVFTKSKPISSTPSNISSSKLYENARKRKQTRKLKK